MAAEPMKRKARRTKRGRGAAATPTITKVVAWNWTAGPSKRLLVQVESAGRRLALQISASAALALEEAIRNAWVADNFF